MANIRKRGKSWSAQIIRKGYKTVHRTFDTRADAEAWARSVETKMLHRDYIEAAAGSVPKLTLADALDKYERSVSSGKKGARQERTRIRAWKKHPLALRPLADLTSADFATYRDDMRKSLVIRPGREPKPPAENTIRLNLALISHLFTMARKEWDFVQLLNPLDAVTKPKGAKKRKRRISPEEIQALIDATDSAALAVVLRLAIETAMRRSEIVTTMVWENISFDTRVASLPDTKNDGHRDVPLSAATIALLQSLPGERKGRVFKVTPDAITRAFSKARKKARRRYEEECAEKGEEPNPSFLMNVRFHDSRHEATSSLFEKDLGIMEVAAVTGHKDLRTLQDYTHLNASKIAAKIDASVAVSKGNPVAPHPGEKLREYLTSATAITAAVKKTGISRTELQEIVASRARIDASTALRLEPLGPRAEFWIELQAAYDLAQARIASAVASMVAKNVRKPRKAVAGNA